MSRRTQKAQRWTEAKVAQVRFFAETGSDKAEIAAMFGCSPNAIRIQAARHGIVLPKLKNPKVREHPGRPIRNPDDRVRARRSRLIGPLKAALRADLVAMGVVEPR